MCGRSGGTAGYQMGATGGLSTSGTRANHERTCWDVENGAESVKDFSELIQVSDDELVHRIAHRRVDFDTRIENEEFVRRFDCLTDVKLGYALAVYNKRNEPVPGDVVSKLLASTVRSRQMSGLLAIKWNPAEFVKLKPDVSRLTEFDNSTMLSVLAREVLTLLAKSDS